MQDRVPMYPGRVRLMPVPGQDGLYDMVRADQPTQEGTPLNKATLLSDETAALYGLGQDAVPDDVFASIVSMLDGNWYNIHVQLPDGTPVAGAEVRGLTPTVGTKVYTNRKGDAFGKSNTDSASIQVISPYYDFVSSNSISVPSTAKVTRYSVTLQAKALTYPFEIASSQKVRFSPKFGNVDMFLVGGGGSGAICGGYTTCSTGGGGGFTQTVKKIDLSDKEVLFTIGSGGSSVSSPNSGSPQNRNGIGGGSTSVSITGGQNYSVRGGGGGIGKDGGRNTSAMVSAGPADGCGKSAWVYINNTMSSPKHRFTEAQSGARAFGESGGAVYGSGGGAYVRNLYDGSNGVQAGVDGGSGAGGYTLGQNGFAGQTYGSGGGPGCIDNYGSIGGKTCTSGAGKGGVVLIRKAVV